MIKNGYNDYNKKGTLKLIFFLINPILIIFLSELVYRESIFGVLNWIGSNFLNFIFSYLMLFSIITIIYTIIHREKLIIGIAYILSLVIAGLNNSKILLYHQPLFWGDIFNIKLCTYLLANFKISVFFILSLTIAIIFLFIKNFKKENMITSGWARFCWFVLCGCFIFAPIIYSPVYNNITNLFNVNTNFLVPAELYSQNGILNGLYVSQKNSQKIKSQVLPSALITDKEFKIKNENPQKSIATTNYPNILVFIEKDFWNINNLQGIDFSKSPMEFYELIKSKNSGGDLISPNIEYINTSLQFELLSSFTAKYLSQSENLLSKYAVSNNNYPAIAKYLKQAKYSTVFLNFDKTQNYGEKVYNSYGFDKYLNYSDDDKKIYNVVKEQFESSAQPVFMVVNSQYEDKYYSKISSKISSSSIVLSKLELQYLQKYVDKVNTIDNFYKQMTQYFKTQKQNTLVIVIGNNSPINSKILEIYNKTSIISNIKYNKWTANDIYKMSKIPFAMWSNYDMINKNYSDISAHYLFPVLMNNLQLGSPTYYTLLNNYYNKIPISNRYIAGNDSNNLRNIMKEALSEYDKNLIFMQYGIMFENRK